MRPRIERRRPAAQRSLPDVSYEAGEAFIHVILMMAMEEGRPGIIGHKIDLGFRETRHANGVLHQPRHGLVAHLRHLERVPVQMARDAHPRCDCP